MSPGCVRRRPSATLEIQRRNLRFCRSANRVLLLLEDRQDVAGWILEPGDVWTVGPEHPTVVLFDGGVAFEAHPPGGQRVDGLVDGVYLEVQHGEVGWGRVGLWVDQRVASVRVVQPHESVLLGG